MDQAKRRRLEAAGWRFGTAAEFLELSPEESVYIELKLRLSDALRERRKEGRISQAALAVTVGSSQSRVAKMEASDPSVTIDLLIRSLIALGVSRNGLARIMGFDELEPQRVNETASLQDAIYTGVYRTSAVASNQSSAATLNSVLRLGS